MTSATCSLHRWLVLDAPVYRSLQHPQGDANALLQLRLQHRLIEHTPIEAVARRAAALAAAGFGHLHLVAERVDPALLTRLRSSVTRHLRMELHEWYRMPGDTLAAVEAPDAFVISRLRHPVAAQAINLWPPMGSSDAGLTFHARYVAALGQWERDARDEHGLNFARLYGASIDWDRILPPPRRPGEQRSELGRLLGGVFRLVTGARDAAAGIAGNVQPGLVLAAGEPSSGGQCLEWSYRFDGDQELGLRIELPSRPGASVELIAALGGRTDAPAGFALIEESGEVIVSALTPRWVEYGQAGERVSYHSFADEFGDLRSRLLSLRVQPQLELLSDE